MSQPVSEGDSPKSDVKGALLVVIGEPFSDKHKELILADLTKGK